MERLHLRERDTYLYVDCRLTLRLNITLMIQSNIHFLLKLKQKLITEYVLIKFLW